MEPREGESAPVGDSSARRAAGPECRARCSDAGSSLDALDSELAAILADDDVCLARDGSLEVPSARLRPEIRDRLVGARQCLELLRRAWPGDEPLPLLDGPPGPWNDSPDDRSRASSDSDTRRDDEGSGEGLVPRRIGRFTILGELGHGGFGIVYLARDPALGREVALKLPRLETLASRDRRRRFLAEARVAARLDHPNIVPIYDVGELGDGRGPSAIYIASAYCREGPLSDWIARQGSTVAPDRIARMMIGLAEGVGHLHERGIIHRDLKPSNVLLQRQTSGSNPDAELVPRVADFGLARLLEQPADQTLSGTPIGSPSYMSPEQARGEVRELGPATDVYGLGAILYALLCARPPFRGESPTEVIQQVIQDEPIPPRRLRPGIPRDLETICLTCLRKEPERRYPSAAAFRDDLERFLRREPIRARPVSPAERLAKWAARRKAVAALLGALALSLVAGSAAVVWQWREAVGLSDSLWRQVYLEKLGRAAREWDSGRVEQARALLEETRPGPGRQDLRGFEWFHLDRLCRGDAAILEGHEGGLKALALGQAGRVLVSCAEDSTIRVWDLSTHRPLRTLRPDDRNTISLAAAPDGRLVAAGAPDGTIRLIDVGDGSVVRRIAAHSRLTMDLAISNDGRRLVSGGADRMAKVWDLATGRPVASIAAEGPVLAVAFSPDGRTFAFQNGQSIEIRDACSGEIVRTLRARPTPIRDLAFRPGGKELAAADSGGLIVIWDVESAAPTRWFHMPGGIGLNALAFSPDGRRLLAGGDEPVATIWDVDGGRALESYRGHSGPVTCVAFGPDGRTVISGGTDNRIRIWDPARQERSTTVAAHPSAIRWLRYNPAGDRLVSGDDGGTWRLWDTRTGQPVGERTMPGDRISCLDWSADGKVLALGGKDGTVSLWLQGRDGMSVLPGNSSAVSSLAFAPEGRILAVADEGGSIRIWDLADGDGRGRLSHSFPQPPGGVIWLGFDRDGSRLVACNADGQLTTWDWRAGRSIDSRRLDAGRLYRILVDLGARRAVAITADQSLVIWDLNAALPRHVLKRPVGLVRLILTPAGDRLVTAGFDGCVRAWDPLLGKETAYFKVSSLAVTGIAMRDDGKELAAGDEAGILRFLSCHGPP